MLAQGEDIVPIPGTKRVSYLEQNVASLEIQLSPADFAEIDQAIPAAVGTRYPDAHMPSLGG